MGLYGTTDVRMEEKAEMVELNNKLAAYMQKVRQLGAGSDFLQTLQSMENDVRKLKAMYENELDKCRQKLEDANRQKNNALSDIDKCKRVARDLQDTCQAEKDKNKKLIREMSCLQQRLADVERELANAKSAAQTPQALLANTQRDLSREQEKNRDLGNELDKEKTKNKQLEDKVKNLQEKVNFNGQLSNEQLKDTNNRLEQAKQVIKDMEARNKDLEKQNAGMPQMLDKMRKKTDDDLAKFKADVENNNKKNSDIMRRQVEDQSREIEQLKADNAKMEKENQRLMQRLRYLEGEVKELNDMKAFLEQQNRLDRSKSLEKVRKLEQQLKELQDLLMEKMAEVNASKDVQMSLKAEIQQYRALLDEEEGRLRAKDTNSPVLLSRGNLSSAASNRSGYRPKSVCSDTANDRTGDKLGIRKAGPFGKYDPQTEYQFSYNKFGRRIGYGDSGLHKRTKSNGLPVLMPASGKGNSLRYSCN